MRPFLRPGVVFHQTGDRCDVLDLIDLRHFEMTPAAHQILASCDGKHTLEELVLSLQEGAAPDGGDLATLIPEFVNSLIDKDLLLSEEPSFIREPAVQPPGVVFFEMTRRCNLRCVWCYNDSHAPLGDELTTEQWKRCIDQLSGHECTFLFTGGEALARRDLLEIAGYAKAAGCGTQLFTNGTLIDEHNSKAIAETFDYVRITIDGASAATNDVVRGKGAFDRALRGMRTLIDSGGRVCWQAIVSQHNIRELPQIVHKAIEVGAAGLRMASVDPIGRGCATRELELSAAQEFVFWRFLAWAMEEYKSQIQIDWGADYCLEEAWNMTMAIEPGTAPSATPEGRRNPTYYSRFVKNSQCGVGKRSFLINSQGDIGLCPLMAPPELTLGNVLVDDPLEVWYNHPMFSAFRDKTIEDYDDCSKCGYRYRCHGGCRGRAFQFLNSLTRCDEKMLKYFVVPGQQSTDRAN